MAVKKVILSGMSESKLPRLFLLRKRKVEVLKIVLID